MENYFKMVKCSCAKKYSRRKLTPGFIITPEGVPIKCCYCKGTAKIKEYRPHPSHKMSRWKITILAPCGTPRFYNVRRCTKCKKEERNHAAGHFLNGLGVQCTKIPFINT